MIYGVRSHIKIQRLSKRYFVIVVKNAGRRNQNDVPVSYNTTIVEQGKGNNVRGIIKRNSG